MNTLTGLLWVTLVAWVTLAVLLLPPAVRSFRSNTTTLDLWLGSTFFTSVVFISFTARRLFIEPSEITLITLQLISVALAAYKITLLVRMR